MVVAGLLELVIGVLISGDNRFFHRVFVADHTIMNRMAQWQYSKEQKEELHKMMALGMTKAEMLAIFYPETGVAKMREIRRTLPGVKKDKSVKIGNGLDSERNLEIMV